MLCEGHFAELGDTEPAAAAESDVTGDGTEGKRSADDGGDEDENR